MSVHIEPEEPAYDRFAGFLLITHVPFIWGLMNVSDGCPTLTCLSLKLRRCYFYVISTVSMTLVIILIN